MKLYQKEDLRNFEIALLYLLTLGLLVVVSQKFIPVVFEFLLIVGAIMYFCLISLAALALGYLLLCLLGIMLQPIGLWPKQQKLQID